MNSQSRVSPPVVSGRRQRVSLFLERYLLPLGLALYVLAYFLPLSGKASNNVFYVLGALPALIWACLNPGQVKLALRAFGLFWLFLLVYGVWGLLSPHPVSPKPVLYLVFLFLALWATRHPEGRMHFRLFAWLGLLAVLALLWATVKWFQLWSLQGTAPRVVLWDGQNPLRTSMMICAGLAWGWLFLLQPRLADRTAMQKILAFMAVLVLMAWTAVVFQSRSVLLGMGAFIGLLLVTQRGPGALLSLVALLVVGLLAWSFGWHEVLAERGLSYRMDIWKDAWQRLSGVCGLWVGCGDDGYLFIQQFTHPHSAYWSILYEHGALVFMLFLLCALVWLVRGVQCRSLWLLVAIIGWGGVLTTTGGVIHSPAAYWVYFWIPTFLAMIECQAVGARQA